MAAPRVLGNIQEFDPQVETITTYLERLELYFDANTVAAEKKVSALLYGIGPKVYGVLRSLLAPTCPQDHFLIREKLAPSHQVGLGIYKGCVATPEVSQRAAGEISGNFQG